MIMTRHVLASAAIVTLGACNPPTPLDRATNAGDNAATSAGERAEKTTRRDDPAPNQPVQEPAMQPDPATAAPPSRPPPPAPDPGPAPGRVILPSPIQPPAEIDPVQPDPGNEVPR